jgi:hypothetical protein
VTAGHGYQTQSVAANAFNKQFLVAGKAKPSTPGMYNPKLFCGEKTNLHKSVESGRTLWKTQDDERSDDEKQALERMTGAVVWKYMFKITDVRGVKLAQSVRWRILVFALLKLPKARVV